jgi:hypothetical protein
VNTRLTPGTTIGKILAGKVAVVDYLKTKESADFSWTGLSTGMFFDWVSSSRTTYESHYHLADQ